ncbi:MAG: glycosyltransferase family 2 protein [Selenomonadaceae bacterium]|nr:glycosyltransferase family 2 protein [Selenomonadaceae bacterium]
MTFRIIHATIFQRGAIAIIKISACVITKNEEKNIQQWLDCVKEFSDEIIVVDTGSEDRTVELAKAGGAAVYHFDWCNDFSAAKNYALDQATGDWIVFLDADEYFGDSIKAKFRATLELIHGNQTILGIDSLLYNIDADHNNEIKSTANQKRIFRNMKQLRYQGRIHEYLAYSGKKAMGFAYSEKFAIYHTG